MKFFESNEWYWRMARTIVQGLIAVVIANLDVLIATANIDPTIKPMIVAGVMAILSPVMAQIKEPKEVE